LVPIKAGYFESADLLVAADCSAFACGSFQADYLKGRAVLVGCPKLDGVDYSEKLGAIITENTLTSITVLRMEVPCCGGIEFATRSALERSGKDIPLNVVTLSITGEILL
jgi:phosphohistidine swiveling domain-containing protein